MKTLSAEGKACLKKTLSQLISAIDSGTIKLLPNENLDVASLWYIAEYLFDQKLEDFPQSSWQVKSPTSFFLQQYQDALVTNYDKLTKLYNSLSEPVQSESQPHLSIKRGTKLTVTLHKTDGTHVVAEFSINTNAAKMFELLIKNSNQLVPLEKLSQAIELKLLNPENKKQIRNTIGTIRKSFGVSQGSPDDFIQTSKHAYSLNCSITIE